MDQLELAPSISSISMVPVVFDSIDPPSKLMSEPTTAPSVKPKLHLDLRASDEDANHGLFKFFPKISRDQYLKDVSVPFTWEIEQRERDSHFLRVQETERVDRKRQAATERKRQQRAREKAVCI